jgi:uncharacterized membrane protein
VDRRQLKQRAKDVLSGNWGVAVVVYVINTALCGLVGAIVPGLGAIAISGPMEAGVDSVYMTLQREEEPSVEQIFSGFENFLNTFLAGVLKAVFVGLWSLLLIVPGIVMNIAYSQTFYILNDEPDLEAMDALRASKELMDGHKMEYFLLQLSFLPWLLLCVFILPVFYVVPYISATNAAYYDYLLVSSGMGGQEEEEHTQEPVQGWAPSAQDTGYEAEPQAPVQDWNAPAAEQGSESAPEMEAEPVQDFEPVREETISEDRNDAEPIFGTGPVFGSELDSPSQDDTEE